MSEGPAKIIDPLLKKSPFFVLGLHGADRGRSCNRLASLVARARQPHSSPEIDPLNQPKFERQPGGGSGTAVGMFDGKVVCGV